METNSTQELSFARKALDILLAIDHIRDAARGPTTIFSGIVKTMMEQFNADLCHLYLVNTETGDLELKVVQEQDNAGDLCDWSRSHNLAQQALDDEEIKIWHPGMESRLNHTEQLPSAVAMVPIYLTEAPLGALVLVRASQPFDAGDVALLRIAESQIDSAIIQAYKHHELAQRNAELEAIYKFDRIRDQNLSFDDMLTVVLEELCTVIHAETGFVMLYNREGEQLEMRAFTHDVLTHDPVLHTLIHRASDRAIHQAELVQLQNDDAGVAGGSGYHVICVPLILRDEIIGVFGAVNGERRRGFTTDERRLLEAIVSQMDTAILESIERRQLRRVLGRSVDPQVLEKVFANPNFDVVQGERLVLTVLYADLRDSTVLAESLPPHKLMSFVNSYLSTMTEVVLSHGGTLDKFVGDEVMALFGAPLAYEDHALRAVKVGLAMQEAYQGIQNVWAQQGIETSGLGIGIATGPLIVGEFGCEQRTDYTVMGPAANLGARICSISQAGEVLICPTTYDHVQAHVKAQPRAPMRFKGFNRDMTIYSITEVKA